MFNTVCKSYNNTICLLFIAYFVNYSHFGRNFFVTSISIAVRFNTVWFALSIINLQCKITRKYNGSLRHSMVRFFCNLGSVFLNYSETLYRYFLPTTHAAWLVRYTLDMVRFSRCQFVAEYILVNLTPSYQNSPTGRAASLDRVDRGSVCLQRP